MKELREFCDDLAAPRPAVHQAEIVGAIASWCEALHGTGKLETALAELARGLGAEAALLVRTHLVDGSETRIALHDAAAASRITRPLRLSFGDAVFGHDLRRPKAGTSWFGSACADAPDPLLQDFQTARGFREFCVLVLGASATTRDHIELHFRDGLSSADHALLIAVVPTMARTWATRQIGLVTRVSSAGKPAAQPALPILSVANPARLSRAEFRVGLLLSRGLSVRGVCAELAVSEATVRTHLRNIYAKTDTGSLAELVFKLIGTKSAAADLARCA